MSELRDVSIVFAVSNIRINILFLYLAYQRALSHNHVIFPIIKVLKTILGFFLTIRAH